MLLFILARSVRDFSFARISIHLMLLFIQGTVIQRIDNDLFQYISCYCLSSLQYVETRLLSHFNTSHVTVYRRHDKIWKVREQISIHLMLLFIHWNNHIPPLFLHFNTSHVTVYRFPWRPVHSFSQFQYISCYCLSKGEVFITSTFTDFNTSHVTVYRGDPKGQPSLRRFQYISCYCLSSSSSTSSP